MIINERWRGKSSSMFGLMAASTINNIISSELDADEVKRLFKPSTGH